MPTQKSSLFNTLHRRLGQVLPEFHMIDFQTRKRAKFCGPGTRVSMREKRGDHLNLNPQTDTDYWCYLHDKAYENPDLEYRNKADRELAEGVKQISSNPDAPWGQKLNAQLINKFMNVKSTVGFGRKLKIPKRKKVPGKPSKSIRPIKPAKIGLKKVQAKNTRNYQNAMRDLMMLMAMRMKQGRSDQPLNAQEMARMGRLESDLSIIDPKRGPLPPKSFSDIPDLPGPGPAWTVVKSGDPEDPFHPLRPSRPGDTEEVDMTEGDEDDPFVREENILPFFERKRDPQIERPPPREPAQKMTAAYLKEILQNVHTTEELNEWYQSIKGKIGEDDPELFKQMSRVITKRRVELAGRKLKERPQPEPEPKPKPKDKPLVKPKPKPKSKKPRGTKKGRGMEKKKVSWNYV